MNLTLLAVYLTSITLLVATPGPVVALVVQIAVQRGFRQAVLTVLGTNAASLVLIGVAAAVLSGLLAVDDRALGWVSLAGCLFIGGLAVGGLRDALGAPASAGDAPARRAGAPALLRGFLIGISNPKDIVFFVAFFPQFIGVTGRFQTSLALLTALWVLCDFLILLAYATATRTAAFRHQTRLISLLSSGFLLVVAVAGFVYALCEVISR